MESTKILNKHSTWTKLCVRKYVDEVCGGQKCVEDGSVSRTEMCGGGKCVEEESVWRMKVCGG